MLRSLLLQGHCQRHRRHLSWLVPRRQELMWLQNQALRKPRTLGQPLQLVLQSQRMAQKTLQERGQHQRLVHWPQSQSLHRWLVPQKLVLLHLQRQRQVHWLRQRLARC